MHGFIFNFNSPGMWYKSTGKIGDVLSDKFIKLLFDTNTKSSNLFWKLCMKLTWSRLLQNKTLNNSWTNTGEQLKGKEIFALSESLTHLTEGQI